MADILLLTTLPRPSVLTDDESLIVASLLDDEATILLASQRPSLPTPPVADEDASLSPPAFFLESEDLPPVASFSTGWTPFTITDESEGASLKDFFLELEDLPPVATFSTGWTPFSFADEDPAAALNAAPFLESEDAPVVARYVAAWTPFVVAGEEPGVALYHVLESEDAPSVASFSTGWTPFVITDESEGASLKNFFCESEDLPPVAVYTTNWKAFLTTDEDAFVPQLFGLLDTQDYIGTPLRTPRVTVAMLAIDAAAATIQLYPYLESEDQLTVAKYVAPWNPVVITDESEGAGLIAAAFAPNEEYVIPGFVLRDPARQQTVSAADEEGAALKSFGLDEEPFPVAEAYCDWEPHVFADEDGLPFPTVLGVNEEEQGPYAPLSPVPWRFLTIADDSESTILSFVLTEEDGSPAAIAWLQWTATTATVITDENEGASLLNFFIEEEAEPPRVQMLSVWQVLVSAEDVAFVFLNGPPPSAALVTALSNQLIASPQTIALDANGNSELRPILFDFRKDSVIQSGDSLVSPQTLVFSQADDTGEPAIVFGGWTQAGNVAAITCSAPGSQVNAVYELVCRATTTQGNTIEKNVYVLIVGVG